MANIALQDNSFEEILADPDKNEIVNDVIKLKGDVLFSKIKLAAGEENFDDFLRILLQKYKYRNISFGEFDEELKNEFGIELEPMMNSWFKATALPGYLVSPIKGLKVKDGDVMKTMISLKVTNFSDVDGLVKLTFRLGGGGGRMGRRSMGAAEMENKIIELAAHQTKELSYLFDGVPRTVIFNSLTSKNIPQTYMEFFREVEENLKSKPWEGERVSETPVQTKLPNESIVDNEDPGFEVTENHQVSLLEKLIINEPETEQKYSSINWWRPPTSWTAITGDEFYGEYVRSAYYIKGGTGEQVARWNVPVREPGYYDVYYHFYKGRNFRRRGGEEKGSLNFIIHADDGKEEAYLESQSTESGWVHLGSFYFSSDKATIELTDKTELRMIYADAVKIVEL